MSRCSILLLAPSVALVACLPALGACSGKSVLDPAAGGGTTGSGTTTSSGSGGGYEGMTCAELAAEYLLQFEHARMCAPPVSMEQCTLPLGHDLYCPCPRMVNPANEEAIATLQQLQAQWDADSCPPVTPTCDAGLCPEAGLAWCEQQPPGSSVSGLCTGPP